MGMRYRKYFCKCGEELECHVKRNGSCAVVCPMCDDSEEVKRFKEACEVQAKKKEGVVK